MAPSYKLTYFNGRGVAEVARLMFAYAEVDYQDVRIEKENWLAIKPNQPFGKLPVLEVDGELIAESGAINRFLAKKFGLNGKTDIESAKADMVLSALKDLTVDRGTYMREEDPAKKEEMKKKFITETLPPFLVSLEKILKSSGGNYLAGNSLTYADIAVAYGIGELTNHAPQVMDKFPGLKGLSEKVLALPNIKKWTDKRPQTQF